MVQKEKCGINAIYIRDGSAAELLYNMSFETRHRGPNGYGICLKNDRGLHRPFKKSGLLPVDMEQGFREIVRTLEKRGRVFMGISHLWYGLGGPGGYRSNIQPVYKEDSSVGQIALGHNGNIVNAREERERLKGEGALFSTTTDSEVFLHYIGRQGDVVKGIKEAAQQLRGSYCLVMLTNDGLCVVRDPSGLMPLSHGWSDGIHAFSSESTALRKEISGTDTFRNIKPGTIILVRNNGELYEEPFTSPHAGRVSHCAFQYIYYSRPDSLMDGAYIHAVRRNIGEILAREVMEQHPDWEIDFVQGVPESGKHYGDGFSEYTIRNGRPIPQRSIVQRNREYRTFLEPDDEDGRRQRRVSTKHSALPESAKEKGVLLIDDSLVRGNTSRMIVNKARLSGASRIYFAVAAPPIFHICPYGIDMQEKKAFATYPQRSTEDIKADIGADGLHYISYQGFLEAFKRAGIEPDILCDACWTGNYPIELPGDYRRL